MVSRIIPTSPFDFVLFGATGDLARRKILPGLFHRFIVGQIPSEAKVICVARSEMSHSAFVDMTKAALVEFAPQAKTQKENVSLFLKKIKYIKIDVFKSDGWNELANTLRSNIVHVFYLSVAPSLIGHIASTLKERGIAGSESRIVVEKPFGHNLHSAKTLNANLCKNFDEHQIYRIDHYLGKETVQNLMALRFANSLWEPLWNSSYIDHVQITVAETIGVKGRGGYYDSYGAMRDMVQNHLMQLLCLIAMEPPSTFKPDSIRYEKVKVIKALKPLIKFNITRGQYQENAFHRGYLDDLGHQNSQTETFVALKAEVSNWRWSGTPFYLRTGKRMHAHMSEIAVVFKNVPHSIFSEKVGTHSQNVLIFRLQPDENITLRMNIKEPGPGGMRLTEVPLDMRFAEQLGEKDNALIDAYERLIMDVVRGDQTLFMRSDEVEESWRWIDPIIENWNESKDTPEFYDCGSSGPKTSHELLERDGRAWR